MVERPSASAPSCSVAVRGWRRVAVCLGVPLLLACGRPSTGSPEDAVATFIDRMERVHGDPAIAEQALALLSSTARLQLRDRAALASAVVGHTLSEADMLAPSYFLLEYAPERMSARIAGDRATVSVGGAASGELRSVPCVLEEGRWRVDIEFPAAHTLRKRSLP